MKYAILICIAIIATVFASYHIDKKMCLEKYAKYNPQYSFWGGCQLNWQGEFIPVDMILNINEL